MTQDVKREPSPRRRVPRAVRERQMLEVAEAAFAEAGFEGVSMDDIAERAGITKPMLYAYFGSKDGLFAAAAEKAGERLQDAVRGVAEEPGAPPDVRLWRGLLTVFAFVDEHRAAWALLYPAGQPAGGPIGAGAHRARATMAGLIDGLFRDAASRSGLADQAAEQGALMAPAFTAATVAAASAWLESDEPRELAALRLMNLVWTGFGGMLDGRMWMPPD